MSFLGDLRRCLERPDSVAWALVGVAPQRKTLLDALCELEARGASAEQIERLHQVWTAKLESFVLQAKRQLVDGLAYGAPAPVVAALVDVALRRRLGLADTAGSATRDRELDRISSDVLFSVQGESRTLGLWPERYAIEVRAIRRVADRFELTALGERLVELPDLEAVRWLVAAEVTQARGDADPWHLSRLSAARLLERASLRIHWYGNESDLAPMQTLDRLAALGLFTFVDEPEAALTCYELTENGRSILAEVCLDESPLVMLANFASSTTVAGIRDEVTAAIVEVVRNAVRFGATFPETTMGERISGLHNERREFRVAIERSSARILPHVIDPAERRAAKK